MIIFDNSAFKNATLIISVFCFFFIQNTSAQDFMMQGWYWDFPKTCDGNNWANTLEGHATDLGNAGITFMWMPPLSRASFGTCSNGYDPKDIYDLGEFGQGATHFGTRTDVDNLITALTNEGIQSVADVVYNHRDGGDWEDNPAVQDYILNYPNNGNCGGSVTPYPVNGKVRYILDLGGPSLNGAGDYYFKFSTSSGNGGFNGVNYKIYFQTTTVGFQGMSAEDENEPNGGGDCGEPSKTVSLGIDVNAVEEVGGGCNTDEFHVNLSASDFNAAGDQIEIYIEETGGSGSGIDIRPYGLWSASRGADIIGELKVQTRTDFSGMPSGQGSMNYQNFQPASVPNSGAYATCLTGDWDFPYFFFDVENDNPNTLSVYRTWSEWLWNTIGIRGYRMDAVKHFNYAFVSDMMNNLHSSGINPPMVVGEFFDTNAGVLKSWVDNVESGMSTSAKNAIKVRVFDFELRQMLKNACDNFLSNSCGSGSDARDVFTSGVVDGAGGNSFNVVTFINNHDYREAGQPVQNDPLLAYTYLLTNNQIGLPSIFYSDYFNVTPPHYPVTFLQTQINNLIEVHQDYIFGATSTDYLNSCSSTKSAIYNSGFAHTSLIYQLLGGVGGKEVIVAINFASGDELDVDMEINMTNLSAGATFVDQLGTSSGTTQINLTGSNQLNLKVPARSYAVWVEGNVMPIELTDFQAVPMNNKVKLKWNTASEIDFEGYEIQRSLDGKTFEKIGFVAGEGDENRATNYQFMDENPVVNQQLYYRLKLMDLDGKFDFSKIERVKLENDDFNFQLFPNPTKAETQLIIDAKNSENVEVSIFDLSGKMVFTQIQNLQKGKNQIALSTHLLNQGIYFVEIQRANGKTLQQKLIKT